MMPEELENLIEGRKRRTGKASGGQGSVPIRCLNNN